MKKISAALFLLLASIHLFSQNKASLFVLHGNTVVSTTKKNTSGKDQLTTDPAAGVVVELRKDEKTVTKTFSDKKGNFHIQMNISTTNKNHEYCIYFSVEKNEPDNNLRNASNSLILKINTFIPIEEYNAKPLPKYNFDIHTIIMRKTAQKEAATTWKIHWDSEKHEFAFDKTKQTEQAKTFSIAGNLYINENNTPLENSKVTLVNKKGEVVQTTTTNSFGSFVFSKLIQGEDYTIAVVSVPPKITITKTVLKSHDGKIITTNAGGKMFKFEVLASDSNTISRLTVDDVKLLADVKGRLFSDKELQTPLVNAKIILKNEKGEMVGVMVTNGKGFFQFFNLPSDQNFILMLDEKDASLLAKGVFLSDANGRFLKIIKSKDGNFFQYAFLPTDKNGLTSIYYDDPWLKVGKNQQKDSSITIIENIYYEFNKWDLLKETTTTLNKIVSVMKTNPDIYIELISHTDSRGTDEFNMELSQKRAQTAIDYITQNGIEKGRISGKGMGETQLINKCKDGIDCTEEEQAQNRRTEFVITKK